MTEASRPGRSRLATLFAEAVRTGASDIHIATGDVPWMRIGGELQTVDAFDACTASELDAFIDELTNDPDRKRLMDRGSFDGAVTDESGQRYRYNIFRCGGQYSIAFRALDDQFQPLSSLGLPDELYPDLRLQRWFDIGGGPHRVGQKHNACHSDRSD